MIMANDENQGGPLLENLRGYALMMPKLVADTVQGRIGGKGLKRFYSKICRVCRRQFAPRVSQKIEEPKEDVCPEHKIVLRSGKAVIKSALASDTRFLIVKPPEDLADEWCGLIVILAPAEFEAYWEHAKKLEKPHQPGHD